MKGSDEIRTQVFPGEKIDDPGSVGKRMSQTLDDLQAVVDGDFLKYLGPEMVSRVKYVLKKRGGQCITPSVVMPKSSSVRET